MREDFGGGIGPVGSDSMRPRRFHDGGSGLSFPHVHREMELRRVFDWLRKRNEGRG